MLSRCMGVGLIVSLGLGLAVGCSHKSSPAPEPETETETASVGVEATHVHGRVRSLDGEPIAGAWTRAAARGIHTPWNLGERARVEADGRFDLTLAGFGARSLAIGADGFLAISTLVYADGSDVELEIRLARDQGDQSGRSELSYAGPLDDTRRLGELQAGALCRWSVGCPPPEQRRAMIEEELAVERSKPVRIALWLAYLSTRDQLAEVHPRDKELAVKLMAALEPNSWRWVEKPAALVVAARVTGDWDYFMRAFEEHPDPDMASELLFVARSVAEVAGEQDEVERFDRLAEHPRVTSSKLLEMYASITRAQQRPGRHGPPLGAELAPFTATTLAGQQLDADHLPGTLTLMVLLGLLLGFGGARLGAGEGSPALAAVGTPVVVGAPPVPDAAVEMPGPESAESHEPATPQPSARPSEPEPASKPTKTPSKTPSKAPSKARRGPRSRSRPTSSSSSGSRSPAASTRSSRSQTSA